MTYHTFSIVTPCLDAEKTIAETIESVVTQYGEFNIQYVIVDGGSTDKTREIISRFCTGTRNSSTGSQNNGVEIISLFEPDNGMYDAIVKGFDKITGEIVAYINAGDCYRPGTFGTVLNYFTGFARVKWITGRINILSPEGSLLQSILPFRYQSDFIQKGIYNGRYLPFIPQESTFWRKELLDCVDLEQLKKYKLAGDYFLWHEFSKREQLFIMNKNVSGFRIMENQKSADKAGYMNEVDLIRSRKIDFIDHFKILFEKLLWYSGDPLKTLCSKQILQAEFLPTDPSTDYVNDNF
jgi:glycosyltransferase involved in cell wall biosynthesis